MQNTPTKHHFKTSIENMIIKGVNDVTISLSLLLHPHNSLRSLFLPALRMEMDSWSKQMNNQKKRRGQYFYDHDFHLKYKGVPTEDTGLKYRVFLNDLRVLSQSVTAYSDISWKPSVLLQTKLMWETRNKQSVWASLLETSSNKKGFVSIQHRLFWSLCSKDVPKKAALSCSSQFVSGKLCLHLAVPHNELGPLETSLKFL